MRHSSFADAPSGSPLSKKARARYRAWRREQRGSWANHARSARLMIRERPERQTTWRPLETPMGRAFMAMMSAMAEDERESLCSRHRSIRGEYGSNDTA